MPALPYPKFTELERVLAEMLDIRDRLESDSTEHVNTAKHGMEH